MKKRKTSVNLTEGNYRKIKKLVDQTGRSQSDLINSAVANVPIVVLGNQQTVAEIFFSLYKALSQSDVPSIRREVSRACLCLNTLITRIEALTPSERA